MIVLHPTLTPGLSVVHRDLNSQAGLASFSPIIEFRAVA